jgi:hypothetical protein
LKSKQIAGKVTGTSGVKVKVKFTLEEATMALREGKERYSSTLSLTSALHGSGWSASSPDHFTPGNVLVPIV